jgi:hypothetical protein
MMTTLDLRLEYRFDTGCAPTFGKYNVNIPGNQGGCNYNGYLKPDYVKWLEERYSKLLNKVSCIGPRLAYKQDTGKESLLSGFRSYERWLEEKVLLYERANRWLEEKVLQHEHTKPLSE